jgi:hypothetical protein
MRAVDQQRTRRCEEVVVEISFAKRHIGAVFAVEYERKRFAIPNSEDDQRRQALRV